MQIKDGYIAQLTDNTLILKNVGVFYATRCEPVSVYHAIIMIPRMAAVQFVPLEMRHQGDDCLLMVPRCIIFRA